MYTQLKNSLIALAASAACVIGLAWNADPVAPRYLPTSAQGQVTYALAVSLTALAIDEAVRAVDISRTAVPAPRRKPNRLRHLHMPFYSFAAAQLRRVQES